MRDDGVVIVKVRRSEVIDKETKLRENGTWMAR